MPLCNRMENSALIIITTSDWNAVFVDGKIYHEGYKHSPTFSLNTPTCAKDKNVLDDISRNGCSLISTKKHPNLFYTLPNLFFFKYRKINIIVQLLFLLFVSLPRVSLSLSTIVIIYSLIIWP